MHKLCVDFNFKWPERFSRKKKTTCDTSDRGKPVPEQKATLNAQNTLPSTSKKRRCNDLETSMEIIKELSAAGLLPKNTEVSSGGACWALMGSEPKRRMPQRLAAINLQEERTKLSSEKLNAKQRRAERRRLEREEQMKERLSSMTRVKVCLFMYCISDIIKVFL